MRTKLHVLGLVWLFAATGLAAFAAAAVSSSRPKPVKDEHVVLVVTGIKSNKVCTACEKYNGTWKAYPTNNDPDPIDGVPIAGTMYMTKKVDACGGLAKQFDVIIQGGKTQVRIQHDVKTAATWIDGTLVQDSGVCDLSGASVTVTGPFTGP